MIHTFQPDWGTFSLEQTLHRHEARYIRMALEAANGVISRAARLLGLRRHQNLHKILKTRHKNLRDVLTANMQDTNLEDTARGLTEATRHKSHPVRILYVKDDPTVAGLVREIAEHEGWELKQSAAGTTAFEELTSDTEYDLLLVDHELPESSGLELIEHARSTFHRRYMPIVMMSGTLDEAAAREAGADVFLRKPEAIGSLVSTVTGLVDDRDQDA